MVEVGDQVAVHYRGTLDDGEEFDSSAGRDPLAFEVGAGQMIPGFDEAVRGMKVGDSKTVRLEPDQAYGERREDLLLAIPTNQAPDGLEVGQQVFLDNNIPAVVVEIDEDEVTIDANHRLAGEALTFEIEVVSIN